MKNSRLFLVLLYGMLFLLTGKSWSQWIQMNGPYTFVGDSYGGYVQCFAVSSNETGGTILFAGTVYEGIFFSTDNGTSWTQTGLTKVNVKALTVLPNGAGGINLFAGTWGHGVILSTDNGTSWNSVNSGLFDANVYTLALSGTNLFSGTESDGVFLSTNNGGNWTAVNSGLVSSWPIYSLVASGSNLLAGTNGGTVSRSTNNGTSWATSSLQNFLGAKVYAVAMIPNGSSDTNLFAGTYGGGIFLSTNNGAYWLPVDSALTETYVTALALNGTNIFAGTRNGVFLSTNNGKSWTDANSTSFVNTNTGLKPFINTLTISGAFLFAGTDGAGVWRRPLSEMITAIKDNEDQIPARFRLDQNYPNPFNPSTTINYSIPNAGQVTLKVYDVLGNEVATLVNEEESSGNYHIQFNANKLASGVYFYQLSAGTSIITKKLILMK